MSIFTNIEILPSEVQTIIKKYDKENLNESEKNELIKVLDHHGYEFDEVTVEEKTPIKKKEHNVELKAEIKELIQNTIGDKFLVRVFNSGSFYKDVPDVGIMIAASDVEIHNVNGQYPQAVSLILDTDNLELKTQIFGGNGGGCVYRQVDPEHPREKYLAMQRIKIPFRKPKNEMKFVLKAIKTFAERYKQTLIDNKERLMYKDIVDYDQLLS